jgi:lipopolysaccharide transport system ATP-binding protein
MSNLAISVDGLGKRYRIPRAARVVEPRGFAGRMARPFRHLASRFAGPEAEDIWAVKDVSFEVNSGEVIGFIGLNGAGKSTLLKLLSRITEPTEGRAVIHGRVGTLLEVGTGFHPELTGRENIFLSGAILGMKRTEIQRKFDEIIAFAEVERFLDMPVKRYSSRTYVRLAFAVAAHLEPEVLLVDEVLAVGDVAFQKKCLGKMGEVAEQGRTVLFVSHNMVAVQNLCSRAMWLEGGRLMHDGPAADVIGKYLSVSYSSQTERTWPDQATAPGNEKVRLRRVCIRPEHGSTDDPIGTSTPVRVELEYWNLVPDARLHACLHVLNEQQIVAFTTGSNETDPATMDKALPEGLLRSVCHIPGHLFNAGLHRINALILVNGLKIVLRHDNALTFDVVELEERPGAWYGKEPGVVHPRLRWTTVPVGAGRDGEARFGVMDHLEQVVG